MIESKNFVLKWEKFSSNLLESVREQKCIEELKDVTLISSDSHHVKAHKIILCAGSVVLRKIILSNPKTMPLIYLRGIGHRALLSILEFLYHGQTSVNQENFKDFMAISEELKIKGLTTHNGEIEKQQADCFNKAIEENQDKNNEGHKIVEIDEANDNHSIEKEIDQQQADCFTKALEKTQDKSYEGHEYPEVNESNDHHFTEKEIKQQKADSFYNAVDENQDKNYEEHEFVEVDDSNDYHLIDKEIEQQQAQYISETVEENKETDYEVFDVVETVIKENHRINNSRDCDSISNIEAHSESNDELGDPDYEVNESKRYKLRKRTPDKEATLLCSKCPFVTNDRKKYHKHKFDKHRQLTKRYYCKECPFKSKYSCSLKDHERAMHQGEIYQCQFCDLKSSRKGNLQRHERMVHGEKSFKCIICKFETGFVKQYQSHIKEHKSAFNMSQNYKNG